MIEDGDAREVQIEATVAIAIVVALQATLAIVSLAHGWKLSGLPGWIWLVAIVPEVSVLIALGAHISRHGMEQRGRRRRISLVLVVLVATVNVLTLVALVVSLLNGHETSGGELLFKSITIWSTNVVAFGLLYWELDAGGPFTRLTTDEHHHDFQFPQMDNPALAAPGWHARLFDYVYVSFTNSIAFSPTDVMPLTQRAKLWMLGESAISAATVLLVTARAVNILR